MKQQVIRKTLTGDWEAFSFPHKARRFFVKNFTEGDIFVSFEDETAENQSFKIISGMAEEVGISYHSMKRQEYLTNAIYVKGTGEVEVQEVDFEI